MDYPRSVPLKCMSSQTIFFLGLDGVEKGYVFFRMKMRVPFQQQHRQKYECFSVAEWGKARTSVIFFNSVCVPVAHFPPLLDWENSCLQDRIYGPGPRMAVKT